MVQVIQPRDIGGEIGQAVGGGLGGGFGKAMEMLGQRSFQQSAIEELRNKMKNKYQESVEDPITGEVSYQQKANIDPLDLILDVSSGTAAIPGLAQSFMENVAPLYMKRAQSKAASKVAYGDPKDTTEEDLTDFGSLPSTLSSKLSKLSNAAGNRRSQYDVMDESLTSYVPKMGEQAPAYNVPSLSDMAKSSQEMHDLGISPTDIYAAQQQKVQQALQSYQAERQGWEDKVKEFSQARGLEDEQVNFLSGPSQDGGRIGNWLQDNKIENSQFWHDQGYKSFQDSKKRNPGYTDQKLWNESKSHLDNLKNLEARGRKEAAKPWIFPGQNKKARDSFQNSKEFANSYYDMAGKSPETTERLKSILADNGWDEDYSLSIAQSPSEGLENWMNKIPKLPGQSLAMSEAQGGEIGNKQRKGLDIISQSVDELVGTRTNKDGSRIGKPLLDSNDSILLLRNRLVREKNLNKYQANNVIKEIGEKGLLSQQQESEYPLLEQNVKMYPLFQIFTDQT